MKVADIPVPTHAYVGICSVCGPVIAAGKKKDLDFASCSNGSMETPHVLRIESFVPEKRDLRFGRGPGQRGRRTT